MKAPVTGQFCPFNHGTGRVSVLEWEHQNGINEFQWERGVYHEN